MAKKPLPAKHPLANLKSNELLSEATAQSQMEDGLDKAITAADKAKNRARSPYGQRAMETIRRDLLRLERLLRRWERLIEETL